MEAALRRGAVAVRRVCEADAAAARRPLRADGSTPMHLAAERMDGWMILRVLADACAEVDERTVEGTTPLRVALQARLVSTSAALLTLRADAQAHKVELGWTPLHVAAWEGDEEDLRTLAPVGVNLGVVGHLGWAPLHVAVLSGHARAVMLLLDCGVDVTASAMDGQTALHLAAGCGHTDALGLLADNEADVTAIDEDGQTPLHRAALGGHADVVEVLVDKGADVTAVH